VDTLRIPLHALAIRLRAQAMQAVTKAALYLVAGLLVLLAIVFAGIAFYFWLATQFAPPVAALIVAAVLVGAALIIWAVAGMKTRRDYPPIHVPAPSEVGREIAQNISATGREITQNLASEAREVTQNLASEAIAMGERLGREMKGYKLVVTAAIAGMVIARMLRR
jgi:hypothetical protein